MDKNPEAIISCHVHDYFEAACVRKSRIRLSLKSGEKVEGFAHDLVTSDKKEFLIVSFKKGLEGVKKEFQLNNILELEFLEDGVFRDKKIKL